MFGGTVRWGDSGGDPSDISGFPVSGIIPFSDTGIALWDPKGEIKISI